MYKDLGAEAKRAIVALKVGPRQAPTRSYQLIRLHLIYSMFLHRVKSDTPPEFTCTTTDTSDLLSATATDTDKCGFGP